MTLRKTDTLLQSQGNKPRTGFVKVCFSCHVRFYVSPSRAAALFCSTRCKNNTQIRGSQLSCRQCGESYHRPPSQIKWRGTAFCSRRCKGEFMSQAQLLSANPAWQGGVSSEHHRLRASKAWRVWREQVYERDAYTCQFCGTVDGPLEPHHIFRFAFFPEFRFTVSNGVTLCRHCHQETKQYDRLFQLCSA